MAVALVTGVTLLRIPVGKWLGNSVPFILYFPAIVVAGWFGGGGPGLAAALLSGYCAKTWFFEPVGAFEIRDWPSAFRLLIFLGSGVLISGLCGQLHRRREELAEEKALLEARVEERTRHLRDALADMEAFSYTVSHDLRGPLRAIEGYSEILLQEHVAQLTPTARGHLKRIRDAAQKLNLLTHDLLTFAKVSGATIQAEPVAIGEVVTEALGSLPQLAAADATVDAQGCGHTVLANRILLLQVVRNLIENGAKFVMPGVKPVIRLWSEGRGATVRLWVADNGIGIAPEQHERLFKLFERLAPGPYLGTGVGLSIVQRAVTKMDGRVGVESQPGAGSRFWIELPAAPGGAV